MLIAHLFKILFSFKFMHKHYHGVQKKLFDKYGLFKNLKVKAKYDKTLSINLDLNDHICRQIYFLNYYDKRGIAFIKKTLKPNNTFIDIGANIGSYSLIASKGVGKNGKVICFEAIKKTFNKLTKNINDNGLINIEVYNNAIYNNNQILTLFVANNSNLGMSSIHQHDSQSGTKESCEAVTLDSFIKSNSIEAIDLIKIDVEGAELYALEGMKECIQKFKPSIFIELSNNVLKNTEINKQQIIDLLINQGYKMFGINEKGELISPEKQDDNYHNFVFKYRD